MIRNLLFHCYPIRGPVWRWHVEQICKYRQVFNGRRILVVVLDHITESEETVRQLFAPLEAEILIRSNGRSLHETQHFIEAFSQLESLREDEATFYAHAKGVSQWLEHRDYVNKDGLMRWCKALYQINLSRPDIVDRLLRNFSSVGAFRTKLNHGESTWLYSGTFFWIKHSTIFSRDWRDIFMERSGVEAYPGRHIKFGESFGFSPNEITAKDLYGGYVTDDKILGWLKELEAL